MCNCGTTVLKGDKGDRGPTGAGYFGCTVYKAKLTQALTANPTVTVNLNTLSGTPTVARTGTGYTTITLTGEFATASKVHCYINTPAPGNPYFYDYIFSDIFRIDANTIGIKTYYKNNSTYDGFVLSDDLLNDASVTIEVYS